MNDKYISKVIKVHDLLLDYIEGDKQDLKDGEISQDKHDGFVEGIILARDLLRIEFGLKIDQKLKTVKNVN